jgi:tetratricopeptide (TPR) repeat protein
MAERCILRAIRLNNKGVSYLTHSRYDEATTALGTALNLVKASLIYEYDDEARHRKQAGLNPLSRHISMAWVEFLLLEVVPLFSLSCCGEEEDRNKPSSPQPSYVCFSPVEISESLDEVGSIEFQNFSLLIIFNLALAYHMKAIQHSEHKDFVRALKLYEILCQSQDDDQNELPLLHYMALVNNMGHIHLYLQDMAKSKQCFEHLLASLMYAAEIGEGKETLQRFEGFLLNALTLVNNVNAASAA